MGLFSAANIAFLEENFPTIFRQPKIFGWQLPRPLLEHTDADG